MGTLLDLFKVSSCRTCSSLSSLGLAQPPGNPAWSTSPTCLLCCQGRESGTPSLALEHLQEPQLLQSPSPPLVNQPGRWFSFPHVPVSLKTPRLSAWRTPEHSPPPPSHLKELRAAYPPSERGAWVGASIRLSGCFFRDTQSRSFRDICRPLLWEDPAL